jgi:hypothetical protein
MREVRREPTFEGMEVIAPSRQSGSAARKALEVPDVSDAEFETVLSPVQRAQTDAPSSVQTMDNASHSFPGIDLLRQNIPFDSVSYPGAETLSPGFVAFTAFSALAVFWLCGGHVLLY